MVGRYSGLTSSPLSCTDSLWQVQNTCWRCTFSQASATSWKGWKHIWVKRAKLTILLCFICFIQFQPAVKEEGTTQLQMSLTDMYQKQFLFFFFLSLLFCLFLNFTCQSNCSVWSVMSFSLADEGYTDGGIGSSLWWSPQQFKAATRN